MSPRRADPGTDLLDPETARLIAELDALAIALDAKWTIPGTRIRFGYDALVGLVPGLGDAAMGLVSLYLVLRASNLGASRWLLARMVGNVLLDTTLGSVPLAGSVFDVFFKANKRNIRLLRNHIADRHRRGSRL